MCPTPLAWLSNKFRENVMNNYQLFSAAVCSLTASVSFNAFLKIISNFTSAFCCYFRLIVWAWHDWLVTTCFSFRYYDTTLFYVLCYRILLHIVGRSLASLRGSFATCVERGLRIVWRYGVKVSFLFLTIFTFGWIIQGNVFIQFPYSQTLVILCNCEVGMLIPFF